MADFSFVQQKNTQLGSGVGSGSLVLDSAPAEGNVLLMLAAAPIGGEGISSLTQTGVTWTKRQEISGNTNAEIWEGAVSADASATINIVREASSLSCAFSCIEAVPATGAAYDATLSGTNNATSANAAGPSVTPASGSKWLMVTAIRKGGTLTAGPSSGWTALTSSNTSAIFAYKISNSGPGTAEQNAYTHSTSTAWDAALVTLFAPAGSGGVTLNPGDDIQAAVDANPNGTTFVLTAGTYTGQDVKPKTGNTFIGAGTGVTILDGEDTELYAFRGHNGGAWVDNVTIQDLTITRYVAESQRGAIWGGDDETESTAGWTLSNVEVSYGANIGIRIGNTMQVLNCSTHHNATLGIGGVGADVLVDGLSSTFNNYLGLNNPGFESGGSKFVKTDGLIVRNSTFSNNVGVGLWLDINNVNYDLDNNTVEDNAREGICIEISFGGVVRNNTVRGNGWPTDSFRTNGWAWDAGIGIHASSDVEVYGNTVDENFNGIVLIQQPRDVAHGDVYAPADPGYLVENAYIHDNIIYQRNPVAPPTDDGGWAGAAVQDVGDTAIFTSRNNHWENNTYYLDPAATAPFAWNGGVRSVAAWQGFGHDDTGTFITNVPPVAAITAPATGSSYDVGDTISLAGTGTDDEDGTLTGASLVWTSDLDGALGTGVSLDVSTLSVGTHTITLTVTDSGSLTDTDTISVTITSGVSSPYLNLGTDGKDLGADMSIIDDLTATAISGDRRSVTETRYGGTAGQWWSYNGVQRVEYPPILMNTDMPTWTELQAMTLHNISGDTALLALLSGGTIGSGGHVVVLDNTVKYTGDYRMAFPLRPGGDAVPGGTNVVIFISKAIWDSMVANGGVATVLPEKVRVPDSPTLSQFAEFEAQDQLGNFMVSGATKGWRFVGLYFHPSAALTQWSHGVGFGNGDNTSQTTANANIPSNLILDRCFIDGSASCTTIHGIELNSAYSAVLDCNSGDYLYTNFTGESHVLCGYNGPGPFRIINNRINGGTQAFFIGGDLSASGMPSSIEFRWNLMTRPDFRNPSHPSYDGTSGNYLKNAWEVKAVHNLLAEGNVAHNTWYGAQTGAGWLIKAESYGNGGTIGYTADVLVRWNKTYDVSMGANIAGVANVESAHPPQRVFLYDNLFRVGATYHGASSNPFVNLGLQQDCGIVHNTFIAEGTVNVALQFGSPSTDAGSLSGLAVLDNIFEDTTYKWKADGGSGNITTDLTALAPGYEIDENVVIGNNGTYPGTIYSPADEAAIVFEDAAAKNFALAGTTQGSGSEPLVATSLNVVQQPNNAATGVPHSVQPKVEILDQNNDRLTSDTSTVTAELITVSGTGTAVGDTTKAAVAGLATFTDLGVDSAGGGTFKWRFTDGALTLDESAEFTISAEVLVATSLNVVQQPNDAAGGVPHTVQPTVEILDQNDARLTSDTSTVTAALVVVSGDGTAIGDTTKAAVAGLATFTDLGVDTTGGGTFRWEFTDGAITLAQSDLFTVTAAPVVEPGGTTGGGGSTREHIARRHRTRLGRLR